MPRQRRRIVLTTAVICLALISLPFVLTWQQTQQERINRQLIVAVQKLDANAVTDALQHKADANTRSNPDAPSVFVRKMQEWLGRDSTTPPDADTALNEAISAKGSDDSRSGVGSNAKISIVQALLDWGADPNLQYSTGKPPLLRDPPLVAACRDNPIEVVRLLLDNKKKADINAPTQDGITALIEATLQHRTDVVRLLLHHGAKVDIGDSNGMTALMCAAKYDFVDIEEILLTCHADKNIKSRIKNYTALNFANENGKTRSVQLLLQRGAKE